MNAATISLSERRLPWRPVLAGTALVVAAAFSAYWQLFTTWRFWDDEGYMVISLRNFAAGGKLYSEVFSQYGPAYSLFFAALHRFLGVPFDTATARWATLGMWILSTFFAARLARTFTQSWWWALAAGGVTFFQLRSLTSEPLHPVGIVAAVLLAGTSIAATLLSASRLGAALAVAAAAGTVLALVKINVGAFYLAGVGVIALWSTRGAAGNRWGRLALALIVCVAAVLLMQRLLADGWVRMFLVVFLVTAGTTLATIAPEIQADRDATELLWPPLLAVLATGGVILAVSLASGVGPRQLWEGVVHGPLAQSVNFSYGFRWSGQTLVLLTGNAAACVAYGFLRRRAPIWAHRLVAFCRLIVGAGFLISFFHAFAVSVEGYLLSFGSGFLWALAAPLGAPSAARDRLRQVVAALAVFQLLHAYPVAGTQVSLGTILLGLLILFSLHETMTWLVASRQRRWTVIFTAVVTAFPLWGCTRATVNSAREYFRRAPENFSGAHLHLGAGQASTLAVLVANAQWHGDVLFSLPGMFSFNAWSKLPTPNQLNATQWWKLLSESRQRAIAERLAGAARPVIIIQRELITKGFYAPSFSPTLLTRSIADEFEPLFSLDSYEFWVKRGSDRHPIAVARWRPGGAARSFVFFSPQPDLASARRVEFRRYADGATAVVGSITDFELLAAPLTLDRLIPWTCNLSPNALLETGVCDLVSFFDAAGRRLADARFERPMPQSLPL